MPRRSSLRAWIPLVALLAIASSPAGSRAAESAAKFAPVVVRPGSVVRWPGEGIAVCEQGGEKFAPANGACLYAIDLEAKGTIAVVRTIGTRRETRTLKIGDYPFPTESLTGV